MASGATCSRWPLSPRRLRVPEDRLPDTSPTIHLEQIILREIRLPLKEPFRISSGVCTERRICLLQLRDGDGVEVWAECVAGEQPNYSAETIDTAWYAITTWIAPRVIGRAFDHPAALRPELERDFRGHSMAKAAVEMGSWTLAAKAAGYRKMKLKIKPGADVTTWRPCGRRSGLTWR